MNDLTADRIVRYREINDLTVRSSAVRYSNPMRSTALVKKAIKVTGAVCVIGLILSLLILIIVNLREQKRETDRTDSMNEREFSIWWFTFLLRAHIIPHIWSVES